MTDYSKLKNAELESLLKERSLAHTGKKAEMVARLIDSDRPKKDSSSSKPPPTTDAASILSSSKPTEEEDLIDDGNDDEDITLDLPIATTAPAAAALAAGGLSRIKNPTAVPNQISAIDPSKTNDLNATKPAGGPPAKPKATKPNPPTTTPTTATPNPNPTPSAKQPEPEPTPAQDFASGLAATSLATELAKRKTRAAKFGVPETTDPEVVKALERAKKFGTAAGGTALASANGDGAKVGMSKLDEALPERRERKRGRGREDGGAGAENEALKRRRGGRGTGVGERREMGARSGERRGGRNGNGNGNGNGSGNGNEKTRTTAGWMSEADRRQAEARKAKWAAAAPAAAA